MKQKLSDIMDVIDIFRKLSTKHFNDLSVAYKVAKVYKELESHKDFYVAEEHKLVEEYAMKDDKGKIIVENNNQIHFNTIEDAKSFNEGIQKLCNLEVDMSEPFDLCAADFKKNELDLTPIDLIKLDKFINFKLEGDVDC